MILAGAGDSPAEAQEIANRLYPQYMKRLYIGDLTPDEFPGCPSDLM